MQAKNSITIFTKNKEKYINVFQCKTLKIREYFNRNKAINKLIARGNIIKGIHPPKVLQPSGIPKQNDIAVIEPFFGFFTKSF